jgi:hypothetical protein
MNHHYLVFCFDDDFLFHPRLIHLYSRDRKIYQQICIPKLTVTLKLNIKQNTLASCKTNQNGILMYLYVYIKASRYTLDGLETQIAAVLASVAVMLVSVRQPKSHPRKSFFLE